MLGLSNPTKFRKRMAGAGLIGFPLAGLIAALIDADEGTDTAGSELYAIAASHSDAILVAALVFMVSAVLTVPAVGGIVHLVRRRGVTLAHIGGALVALGAFGHMAYATWQLMLTQVARAPDQAALVDFLDRQQAVMTPVVLPLLIAVPVGLLLLAIALRRARLVPQWFLVATIATFAFDVVLNSSSLEDTKLPIVFAWAAFAGLYGYLGVRVLRMSDVDWEKPRAIDEGRSAAVPEPAVSGRLG